MLLVYTNLLLLLTCAIICCFGTEYEPNWKSLDSRPLPSWYDEAKIGIFIHWGVFSVPSYSTEWFWEQWKGQKIAGVVDFMKKNYRPDFTYPDFAPLFTAEFYNADQWANIFDSSGAKYVVLVTKHHEGFTNWPSKVSWNWNSMDVGPKRDLVGELATAVRKKKGIKFGTYHSLFEWFNPLYLNDKANGYWTQDFVREKTMPELYELVNNYKTDIVWSDGAWEAADKYWNSTEFLAWLYNDSPVKDSVVVNDRWGNNTACKHGGFLNCHDQYNPGVLQKRKWENCVHLDKHSWGYRRLSTAEDYITMDDITKVMAETVSCGGNLLVNIGPTHDGRVVPIFEERLRQMGEWLSVNGEAIYASKPWTHQNDTLAKNVWYTSQKTTNGTAVYAIVLDWPDNNILKLGAPVATSSSKVSLLGCKKELHLTPTEGSGVTVTIPPISINEMTVRWAWVFKFTGLSTAKFSKLIY